MTDHGVSRKEQGNRQVVSFDQARWEASQERYAKKLDKDWGKEARPLLSPKMSRVETELLQSRLSSLFHEFHKCFFGDDSLTPEVLERVTRTHTGGVVHIA